MKKYIFFLCCIGLIFNMYYFFYYRVNTIEDITIRTHIDVPVSPKKKAKKRKITIHNTVDKKNTAYRYFGGNYYPNSFTLKANNTQLVPETPTTIEAYGNIVDLSYTYSFAKGLYKGTKTIQVQINPNRDNFTVNFNWKKKPRIALIES